MCLLERFAIGSALLLATAVSVLAADGPQFGKPVTQQDIAAWDISIGPDGAGLPPGKGTVAEGEKVYAAKCLACHGEKGEGRPNDRLVGGMGTLAPDKGPPVKTVGSYWPYATTLFDYVRRAMPWDRPKSLSDQEVYAVAAYILNLNGLIGQDDVIDAQSLPKVKMPNREGFSPFPRWPPPK
jgi:mono/diheme cytochrome c family protein